MSQGTAWRAAARLRSEVDWWLDLRGVLHPVGSTYSSTDWGFHSSRRGPHARQRVTSGRCTQTDEVVKYVRTLSDTSWTACSCPSRISQMETIGNTLVKTA